MIIRTPVSDQLMHTFYNILCSLDVHFFNHLSVQLQIIHKMHNYGYGVTLHAGYVAMVSHEGFYKGMLTMSLPDIPNDAT